MLEGLEPPQKTASYCKVAEVAKDLEAKDAAILQQSVDDPRWSGKALSLALRKYDIRISDTTLLRHRKRECNCD